MNESIDDIAKRLSNGENIKVGNIYYGPLDVTLVMEDMEIDKVEASYLVAEEIIKGK